MNRNGAFLIRLKDDGTQTEGIFSYFREGEKVLELCTLEPAWLGNIRNESCILPGVYDVEPRYSKKFRNHFEVLAVKGRSSILIHAGNVRKETRGCILLGLGWSDLNGDGKIDISSSKLALSSLKEIAPKGFRLVII